MVELVDTLSWGGSDSRRESSSLSDRIFNQRKPINSLLLF